MLRNKSTGSQLIRWQEGKEFYIEGLNEGVALGVNGALIQEKLFEVRVRQVNRLNQS